MDRRTDSDRQTDYARTYVRTRTCASFSSRSFCLHSARARSSSISFSRRSFSRLLLFAKICDARTHLSSCKVGAHHTMAAARNVFSTTDKHRRCTFLSSQGVFEDTGRGPLFSFFWANLTRGNREYKKQQSCATRGRPSKICFATMRRCFLCGQQCGRILVIGYR